MSDLQQMLRIAYDQGASDMQTLDQSLAELVRKGLIRYEDGLEKASNAAEYKALAGAENVPSDTAEPSA